MREKVALKTSILKNCLSEGLNNCALEHCSYSFLHVRKFLLQVLTGTTFFKLLRGKWLQIYLTRNNYLILKKKRLVFCEVFSWNCFLERVTFQTLNDFYWVINWCVQSCRFHFLNCKRQLNRTSLRYLKRGSCIIF